MDIGWKFIVLGIGKMNFQIYFSDMAPAQCLVDAYKSSLLQHMKWIRTMVLNLLLTKVIFLRSKLGIWCVRDIWQNAQRVLSPFFNENCRGLGWGWKKGNHWSQATGSTPVRWSCLKSPTQETTSSKFEWGGTEIGVGTENQGREMN